MISIILIDLVVVISLIALGRPRLEAALPLFCFYLVVMPIESKIVIPGLFDLSTERVAMITVLFLFFTRNERKNNAPIPMKRLMYLHVAWALCSTVYSISVATSTKQLIGQVIEYYLLYFVLLRTISNVQTIYKIVCAMMLAMGLCCVFGVIEAYTYWSILSIFPSNLWIVYGGPGPLFVEWGRGLRIRSTFPHPILFGDALAMSIPITLYLLSIWKKGWQRNALWMSLVLMFWAIYKTSSRGPWIAMAASSVLLFVLVHNRVRRYLTVLAVLTLIVLIARPGIWETVANLYESTQDSASPVGASYEYRSALTTAITNAVNKNLSRSLLGYGLGTFREKGLDIDFLGGVRRWYTCDNNWALFLYETGYVGLVIVSILLIRPMYLTLRSYLRLPRPHRYFSGVLFIALAGFSFALLSVAGYGWGQQAFMAWIFTALAIAYPRLVAREARQSATMPAPLKVALKVPEPQLEGAYDLDMV
jgi:hypothetical protein